MDVNFKVTEPAKSEPIVFDVIFAEKVGGGRVKNTAYDLPVGVAIDKDGYPLKCYKVYEAAEAGASSIKIEKGSGIASGDVLAKGNVAVASTALNQDSDAYDIVTISLGVALAKGDTLYQAESASTPAVQEVAYGYYDAKEGDTGALKVVASSPEEGEIALASVTPYRGIKNLAANDYVLLKNAVEGVAGVDAAPKYYPKYVLGESIKANSGDKLVKLVNGANVRKETIKISDDMLALMPMIQAL